MKNAKNIKNPMARPDEPEDKPESVTLAERAAGASFEDLYSGSKDSPEKMRKLTLRIPESVYQQLRDVKHEHEVTTQEVLENALREHLRTRYGK